MKHKGQPQHPPIATRTGPITGTKPGRDWRGPAVAGIRILANGTVVLGSKP
jgi:hypothetical protein